MSRRTRSPAPFGPTAAALVTALLALAACRGRGGDGGEARPPETVPAEPPLSGPKLFDDVRVESRLGGAAGTADAPIPRCGARDSYRYVAEEFRCPGGGNPFDGDLKAAARSRAGSFGPNPAGHMIDVYEVPCPSGKVDVYIDMYGCPDMERELARERRQRDPEELDAHFAAGRYHEVRTRCQDVVTGRREVAAMTLYHCGIFLPAVLIRGGEPERAVALAGKVCQSYPPVSARSTVRVDVVVAMVDAIGRMFAADRLSVEEAGPRFSDLVSKLLAACAVDADTFLRAFEAATSD
ncbi:MAG TPA: hypothetical protein VIK91_26795 [Nannocystis sp.]